MQSHLFEALMGQVLIRNIDDDVLERLRRRAATQQKSLEQSLREVLAEAAKPSRAELIADLERIRGAIAAREKPGVRYPTTEELIREDRDNR
jgi:plasmid stability protein